MNDLLGEASISYDRDIEMQSIQQADDPLTNFLHKAELLKQEINSIRETLTHHESTSLHIVEVLKEAKTIKARLEEMDRENAGCEVGSALHRTQTTVVNGLRMKLKELVKNAQELRQRRMEIVEEPAQGGEEGLMSRAIQERGRGSVLEMVVEIQDRHNKTMEIAREVQDLQEIQLGMDVMVNAQGERLDTIEHHVMNAAQYVNDGTESLRTAAGYQRKGRKCMCVGIILLLIIIVMVVISVVFSVTKS